MGLTLLHQNIFTGGAIGRTRANETIPPKILSCNDGFEQEAVLRVFCYAEVGHAWCYEVGRQFNIHWHTVPSLLLQNELFDGCQRRIRWQFLKTTVRLVVELVTHVTGLGIHVDDSCSNFSKDKSIVET